MTILVVGASGATGKLLVEQLLDSGHKVKVVVRSVDRLPEHLHEHKSLEIIIASLLDLSDEEITEHVKNCDAVASCLGHNLSLKGIYGKPRKLVTDAARRLCEAITDHQMEKPIKYVLMNTTGNSNRDLKEPVSFGSRLAKGIIRILIPPHVDNEMAADYLRVKVGQNNNNIEWAVVRPDGLIDVEKVSEYKIYPSPIRNPIFNSGKTSRINVAHFMAKLITDPKTWENWKGQMPVIYNSED